MTKVVLTYSVPEEAGPGNASWVASLLPTLVEPYGLVVEVQIVDELVAKDTRAHLAELTRISEELPGGYK